MHKPPGSPRAGQLLKTLELLQRGEQGPAAALPQTHNSATATRGGIEAEPGLDDAIGLAGFAIECPVRRLNNRLPAAAGSFADKACESASSQSWARWPGLASKFCRPETDSLRIEPRLQIQPASPHDQWSRPWKRPAESIQARQRRAQATVLHFDGKQVDAQRISPRLSAAGLQEMRPAMAPA